jgi:hypothetical protein
MTVGVVEATYPSLVGECRQYRAKIFLKLAGGRLKAGDVTACRQYLRAALRDDPFVSWKAPVALLLSAAPAPMRRAAMERYVSPTKI